MKLFRNKENGKTVEFEDASNLKEILERNGFEEVNEEEKKPIAPKK